MKVFHKILLFFKGWLPLSVCYDFLVIFGAAGERRWQAGTPLGCALPPAGESLHNAPLPLSSSFCLIAKCISLN